MALQIKGKTALAVQGHGREVVDLEKNRTARLKFLLDLGEMQRRVLISTPKPAVLMAASGMFAVLWSWGVSTARVSANPLELFRAASPLPWEVMQLQSCEKGDGGTSQDLLFQLVCSNPEENSFLSSPSYSCSPSFSHISLGFHVWTILVKTGVLWKDWPSVVSEVKLSNKGLDLNKALRTIYLFSYREEAELSLL